MSISVAATGAAVTVRVTSSLKPLKLPVMVVVPTDKAVARPSVVILAKAGFALTKVEPSRSKLSQGESIAVAGCDSAGLANDGNLRHSYSSGEWKVAGLGHVARLIGTREKDNLKVCRGRRNGEDLLGTDEVKNDVAGGRIVVVGTGEDEFLAGISAAGAHESEQG